MKNKWIVEANDVDGKAFREQYNTKSEAVIAAKNWIEQGSTLVSIQSMRMTKAGYLVSK